MRALTACFIAVLGFGGLITVAACSSSTTDASGGAGGAAGASGGSVAGAAGKAAAEAGSTNNGEAGASAGICGFQSEACNSCLMDNCNDKLSACATDSKCAPQLGALPTCACDKTKTAESCQSAFVMKGGEKALVLAMCYQTNCVEACQ